MPEHIKKQLLAEIAILEHELSHELPAEIKKAVALGDLSENAEYHMAKQRQVFVNARLGQLTGLPIHLWDERLTTREAHQILYEAGHRRQDHRRVVDQVAATLILKSFLEREPRGTGDDGA